MTQTKRILVVDDNTEFRRNVTDILELRDFEVSGAEDGFAALALAEQQTFDLVLLDVRMPVMDGLEVFRRLQEISPDTPVIMATAFAVEELIRDALREGAFGALNKPLDFDRLFELIDQATGSGMMVLVVDDDELLSANLADVLSERGYRVDVAGDGDRALELARENDLDIMLIDLKLPPLNGLETYLAIRDIRPDMVAIIITGHLDEMAPLARRATANNVYTCLEKPIDMDGLFAILERIERQRREGNLEKPE